MFDQYYDLGVTQKQIFISDFYAKSLTESVLVDRLTGSELTNMEICLSLSVVPNGVLRNEVDFDRYVLV